jgi:hypothetical protein
MNASPTNILAVIALVLGVAAIVKPSWPLTGVAVILLAIAIIIKSA